MLKLVVQVLYVCAYTFKGKISYFWGTYSQRISAMFFLLYNFDICNNNDSCQPSDSLFSNTVFLISISISAVIMSMLLVYNRDWESIILFKFHFVIQEISRTVTVSESVSLLK